MNIYPGTSGYSYKEWKGFFYPEDLPNGGMLKYYGERLPSVEINNTFYRFPNAGMVETWANAVPGTFRFSIKASQKITHIKRLRDAGDEVAYLLKIIRLLGQKLGVLLFQCPPNFKKDLDRLQSVLKILPNDVRCAFEFRHESWFEEDTFDMLRGKDCALCIADTDEELKVPFVSTARWGYLRLRRPDYTTADLKSWYKKISSQEWDSAFVFFKHEDEGIGAKMAVQFHEMALGKPRPPKQTRSRKTK
jgi:uncharacterized protein YecE (DUF72 family)